MSSVPAGLALPHKNNAPSFFAWTPSDIESIAKQQKEPLVQIASESEVPPAGSATEWDPVAPFFYAYKFDTKKEEALKQESRENLRKLLDAQNPIINPIETPPLEPSKEEAPAEEIPVEQAEGKATEAPEIVSEKETKDQIQSELLEHLDQHDNEEVDDPIVEARNNIRRQRKIGTKHRKFESEILQGYVSRTEYMDRYRWPAQKLKDGNIQCVSAYAQNFASRPAGMPISYHSTFVDNGNALSIAKEAAHDFLRKKIVVGGIEDLEAKVAVAAAPTSVDNPTSSTSLPEVDTKSEHKENQKEINSHNHYMKKKETSCLQKYRKVENIPLNFAWAHHPVSKPFFKRKTKKRIKRWKPTPPKLINPIFLYQRYPIPMTYRPRSEYGRSYSRLDRRRKVSKTSN